ncbi:hypothetical protein CspeluHIS016_0110840 [Cutaneotrichosporon spelunceum]|uniref:Uncharacterized protein n=1 Tax=Cutaneotrichosporon spelunceum TaxID=1672016 RepID=A0AAD3TPV5_9TREE|nr:hypothetical protein CspeluHIS016_0110840 [Cutaneotrichosporon spelunceum]
MSHSSWVSPLASTTFSFGADLDNGQWRTLEQYIIDYMLQDGLWPTRVARQSANSNTSVIVHTGAEWSGRFEGDVCTIIYQIVGEIAITCSR